jgi:hypothetical protein
LGQRTLDAQHLTVRWPPRFTVIGCQRHSTAKDDSKHDQTEQDQQSSTTLATMARCRIDRIGKSQYSERLEVLMFPSFGSVAG